MPLQRSRLSLLRLRIAALFLVAGCGECPPPTAAGVEADARVLWSAPLPAAGEGVPVMAGERVVVATDSGLVAFAAATGEVAWRAHTQDVRALASLLYREGRVFYAGIAVAGAYHASSGGLVWRDSLSRDASPDYAHPAVDERAFYIGTRDRRVLALAQESGRVLWDVHSDDSTWLGGEVSGVAVSGDTVYAAVTRLLTPNRYKLTVVLLALDRHSGRELWRTQSADEFTAGGLPLVAGRLLVAGGGAGGTTFAVDRFTGREVWARDLYGYVWGPPVLHEQRLYVGTQAAHLYALDPGSGRSVWERALKGGSTHLAVCGGKLVVENYQVELFDLASGKQIGTKIQLAPGDFVSSGIAVADGRAFFAGQRTMYAIRCD